MKSNKIQVTLPDLAVEKFDRQALKQSRSRSNLAKRYIIEGLRADDNKEKEIQNSK